MATKVLCAMVLRASANRVAGVTYPGKWVSPVWRKIAVSILASSGGTIHFDAGGAACLALSGKPGKHGRFQKSDRMCDSRLQVTHLPLQSLISFRLTISPSNL